MRARQEKRVRKKKQNIEIENENSESENVSTIQTQNNNVYSQHTKATEERQNVSFEKVNQVSNGPKKLG